ncbi:MAG: hypothetical protein GY757_09970 [bacterium]|nr:hypothetical protein [bacterium]
MSINTNFNDWDLSPGQRRRLIDAGYHNSFEQCPECSRKKNTVAPAKEAFQAAIRR